MSQEPRGQEAKREPEDQETACPKWLRLYRGKRPGKPVPGLEVGYASQDDSVTGLTGG